MKHIFIVNPAAGKGGRFELLIDSIRKVCDSILLDGQRVDYDVYVTTDVGDAARYVRSCCQTSGTQRMRFYACGGDGTLCEVINGAVGYDNAEVGLIPAGTGNDFCRNFTNREYFNNIKHQLLGSSCRLDLIKYGGKYGINMFNIGFDSDVAAKVSQIKRNPMIKDGLAYIAGVGIVLMKKMGTKMRLTIDGIQMPERELTLVAVANGSFCGGGFKAAPRASLDDGLMDVCVINLVTRMTFLKLVSSYKEGTHLENEQAKKYITYTKCKELSIDFESERDFCVDGEIERAQGISFSVVPRSISFSAPLGSQCIGLTYNSKESETYINAFA